MGPSVYATTMHMTVRFSLIVLTFLRLPNFVFPRQSFISMFLKVYLILFVFCYGSFVFSYDVAFTINPNPVFDMYLLNYI